MEYLKRVKFYFLHLVYITMLQHIACGSDTRVNTIKVHVGKDAVLPCKYKHPDPDPPPRVIEWMREKNELPVFIKIGKYPPHIDPAFGGRMLVQSGSANLTINRVQAQDEGWYECRVIFLNKEKGRIPVDEQEFSSFINGTWVKLIVTDPPSFKMFPPEALTKEEGEVLLLRCSAAGRPKPQITWLKDELPLTNGQDGVRISDGELAVTHLNKSHKGIYTCRAQNSEGVMDVGTHLYIQAAPVLTKTPKNSITKENQEAVFSCEAKGYPTNIKYQWLYNGEPVASSRQIRGRYSTSSDGTFRIRYVEPSDAGVVTCIASNGFGKPPKANATLTVQFAARVGEMPPFMYAGLGLSVTLECPATGVPPVTFAKWRKDGQLLNTDQGENGSLIIDKVTQSDEGRYTCTPYNMLGTRGQSTSSKLIVKYPPHFTIKPKPEYDEEVGSSLAMSCQGAGDPPPHISWIKIDDLGGKVAISEDDGRVSFKNGNITIHSLVKKDHGIWQCVLTNAVASVKYDVMVYVKNTSPHTVTNISVITSEHSAQVSWTPGYDGGVPQHFLLWYKQLDKGDHSWQTHYVDGHRKVATVGNLYEDTIYQFALLPENRYGSGQFSKTVTAKTKGKPPTTPVDHRFVDAPGHFSNHINDEGYLVLMWQPPLNAKHEDLDMYLVMFRRSLVENDNEEEQEKEAIRHEEVSPSSISTTSTPSPAVTDASTWHAPLRSKRSLKHWNELVLRRVKRNSDLTTESPLTDYGLTTTSKPEWTEWANLMTVNANETELIVPKNKIYRDQKYEFYVVASMNLAYSLPSDAITLSTKGLDVYPILVASSMEAGFAYPATSAAIAAVFVFSFVALILTATWCYRKRKRSGALVPNSFAFGNLEEEQLDRRSRSSESTGSARSDALHASEKCGKNGSIFKLKKKMLKADVQMGHAYASTHEIVGLAHNISSPGMKEREIQTDGKGSVIVRKITRSTDGRFHVPGHQSESESGCLLPDNNSESILRSSSKNSSQTFDSRPHSAEWDSRMPLLQQSKRAAPAEESLEIDCSHSDIEVRYIKDGRGKVACQSSSMSSLAGSRQYNLTRREIGPCDYSFDSSMGDSYRGDGEHRSAPPPNSRQSIVSPVQQMGPHGQPVSMRACGTPRRSNRNPDYRISSPPRFSDHNPAPGSPSKYRYHKHAEQPGGHYRVPPRDRYSATADGLVYDPRYTRIEPIYEMGASRPHNQPNRHSSFVIDTRRELPDHPHPHRAIQICSRTTSVPSEPNDGSSYPTPNWREQNGPQYRTLPHQKHGSSGSRDNLEYNDHQNIEESLIRHGANAVSPRRVGASTSTLNSNSLGRPRKKSGDNARRRVQSLDDLCRDSVQTNDATKAEEISGSIDLLSQRQRETHGVTNDETQHDATLTAIEDRVMSGSDAGDEASDVTISLSSNSSREPDKTKMSRKADKHVGQRKNSTKVVVTSPKEDDSSAVSSLVHPPYRGMEIVSSGYDSHNTSHASSSDSPALPMQFCSPPNIAMRTSSHDHDRTSTASSSDRSRKDNSSVDEKYEWDAEFAMEREILDALRHFGIHNRTGSVSQALVDEIQKLGVDKLRQMDKDQLEHLEKAVNNRDATSSEEDSDRSATVETRDMYTKESMERRCAALRQEYQRYQMEQIRASKSMTTTEPMFSSTPG